MKRALVLGGGGAKGAYELGVWKALNELDIKFDIVVGTSIGALNGVLYVQDDYDKAYELWSTLKSEHIITNGVSIDLDMELMYKQKGKYLDAISTLITNKGVDTSPIVQLMSKYFNPDKFFNSNINYACMITRVKDMKGLPILKQYLTSDNTIDYLRASSACFPAFPMVTINNEKYMDGGFYDNVPVHTARLLGATQIVAIDLKSLGTVPKISKSNNLTIIKPTISLGGFLNFEHNILMNNIDLGYYDTMRIYNKYYGTIYNFKLEDYNNLTIVDNNIRKAFINIDPTNNRRFLFAENMLREIEEQFPNIFELDFAWIRIIEQLAIELEINSIREITINKLLEEIKVVIDSAIIIDDINLTKPKEILDFIKDLNHIDAMIYLKQLYKNKGKKRIYKAIRKLFPKENIYGYILYLLDV